MKRTAERTGLSLHEIYRERLSSQPDHAQAIKTSGWLDLLRAMLVSRRLDEIEAELVGRGEAFFHVSCAGHEGVAALEAHLKPADWLHLHYRDKALQLAHGVLPEAFLHCLLCTAGSSSAGRQMSPFVDDPALHILSPNVPVGNHALQAVGVAAQIKDDPEGALVVCSMGDGGTQQGQVFEAIAEAVRSELPVLFLIEDNGLSISTATAGKTFYSLPEWCGGQAEVFNGLPVHHVDGRDVMVLHSRFGAVVRSIRETRRPAVVVMHVERLGSHTNADDDRVYRQADEVARIRRESDPIRILRDRLLAEDVRESSLDQIASEVDVLVRKAAEVALAAAEPATETDAKAPLPLHLGASGSEYRGEGVESDPAPESRLTMIEAMREVLRARMQSDARVSLYGQDIEDPKGDVFGLTRGLTRAFPDRVNNAPLSEATILGVSIGRALAGGRPVAFIQFADFLPLVYNQVLSELGNMHWRSAGNWQCPVILMVACGAYRPGLGPFHAQTLESVMAHTPGVDVVMPSTAGDAAGLLNAAFESGRPTIVFYPKVSLNDRDRTTSADIDRQIVPIGRARFLSRGDDLTLVSWGSTVPLCEQAVDALADAGLGVDMIDLRSISPWDADAVCESARRTGRLLVVHEDNRTCGFGAEVVATVAERVNTHVRCRRVTRPDTYIPCNFANQLEILPSFRRVLDAASEMLELDLVWAIPHLPGGELQTVEALGPSPADQSVKVLAWSVVPGQEIRAGEQIAEMEADKAVFDMVSPLSGRVAALLVEEGESVRTGAPLMQVEVVGAGTRVRRPTREQSGTPHLRHREQSDPRPTRQPGPIARTIVQVGLSRVATAVGSRIVTNEDLIGRFPGRTIEDIRKRTGIERRYYLGPGESALTLAVSAAHEALDREGWSLQDIDALICCTTTPPLITPSLGCLILNELGQLTSPREIPAHDISAACSGYLYALTAAHDLIQARPGSRVLVISSEALSPLADPDNFDTAIIFGDAATATIVIGPDAPPVASPMGRLRRPVLSAKGESGDVLRVPTIGSGAFLHMNGLRVYAEAIRQMISALERALAEADLALADLDLIVPHQANARIIADIRQRLGLPPERVYVNIREYGNTSSSSIPLCLAELSRKASGSRLGLTAFGGGFTAGAAILELEGPTG